MKEYIRSGRFLNFLKRYGYLFLIGLAFVGVIIMMVVSSIVNVGSKNNDVVDVNGSVISYNLPVLNATIIKNYSDKDLQFSESLNKWCAHKCVDFQVASGSNVYAIADGTIDKIYTNSLDGTVIKIKHDNNLFSEYASVDSTLTIKKGDVVAKGQIIGKASNSAVCEYGDGTAHVHFTMYDGDNKVDPAGFLAIENK